MKRQLIVDLLSRMIGKRVRVNICVGDPNEAFSTQIAVVGILEGNVEYDNFRVLSYASTPDQSSYAYFHIDDISCAADKTKATDSKQFRCGAFAAFYLKGNPVHPYSDMDVELIMNDNSEPMIVVT